MQQNDVLVALQHQSALFFRFFLFFGREFLGSLQKSNVIPDIRATYADAEMRHQLFRGQDGSGFEIRM